MPSVVWTEGICLNFLLQKRRCPRTHQLPACMFPWASYWSWKPDWWPKTILVASERWSWAGLAKLGSTRPQAVWEPLPSCSGSGDSRANSLLYAILLLRFEGHLSSWSGIYQFIFHAVSLGKQGSQSYPSELNGNVTTCCLRHRVVSLDYHGSPPTWVALGLLSLPYWTNDSFGIMVKCLSRV